MAIAVVPGHLPFLDVLARRWLADSDRSGDPLAAARGTILLPTRRAARALGEAFLRLGDGRAMLLPRCVALGALDEAPLLLDGELDLPPAVEPMRRLGALSRLVLAAGRRFGTADGLDQAWPLARALADLMDEAERVDCDLAAALPGAADRFAEHWQVTLEFLGIVTAAWPRWLDENGVMNPVARQMALLRAQAQRWRSDPPPHPVWAAGFTAALPAEAELLGAAAALPQGVLVLQGLDPGPVAGCDQVLAGLLRPEDWDDLPPSHAEAGLARMLRRLSVRREALECWDDAGAGSPSGSPGPDRLRLLARALLPERALGDWMRDRAPVPLDGVSRLAAADGQEEAGAIALAMRAAIEQPGARAALVTPDRALAARVAVELRRWGVAVDDSAGETLADTPPAVLLRLLADAVTEELSPVALLSVLKHPLASGGMAPAAFRAEARRLEIGVLRGPAPAPGLEALRRHTDDLATRALLDRLDAILEPLLAAFDKPAVPPAVLLSALVAAGEALAASDTEPGDARLWSGEEGNALSEHLAALIAACDGLPPQAPRILRGLLDASLAGLQVRSRRALRGLPPGEAEHPRLFIWGLLEARLQRAELMILGGLNEGVWPPAADPGPWMSRPMRAAAGLPSPEEAVGQAAHDFVSACCAAPELLLSCPGRRDGAPAVPARWLVRLDAFLGGRGQALPVHPARSWLRALDQPAGAAAAVRAPRPTPPLRLRPRRLSVTEIETWMRDPYAVFARHVLRLRPLPELEQPADAADYGEIVHEGLAEMFAAHPRDWPADAAARIETALNRQLDRRALRPALAAWWRPRLRRIAAWVAEAERDRRQRLGPPAVLATEVKGEQALDAPGGRFVLSGRADRIEKRADGRLAVFDYKTGTLPDSKAVREGWASQLVLEAAMAARGGFGEALAALPGEIGYWRLSGGHEPGTARVPAEEEELRALAERCWEQLRALVAQYDDPAQPYLSHPRPGRTPAYPDYAQLARVAEWSAAREEGA